MVKIFAPGTIGNVGPGFDILGVAVEGIGDTFEINESDNTSIRIQGRDAEIIPKDPDENTVTLAANALFREFKTEKKLSISIDRCLPSSGGLGASASSSVAGALGAAVLIGQEDNREAIVRAALVAESYVAGNHLDNIAPCVYGGLTIVKTVEPTKIFQVPLKLNLYALLVTPNIKIRTKDSRNVLPEYLNQEAWVKQMASTSCLVAGFSLGDVSMIREGLDDEYAERFRSPLIAGFDQAKKIAMENGAIGFSISGAGPTCFGLFEEKSQAEHTATNIGKAFDVGCTTHVGQLSEQGARVL